MRGSQSPTSRIHHITETLLRKHNGRPYKHICTVSDARFMRRCHVCIRHDWTSQDAAARCKIVRGRRHDATTQLLEYIARYNGVDCDNKFTTAVTRNPSGKIQRKALRERPAEREAIRVAKSQGHPRQYKESLTDLPRLASGSSICSHRQQSDRMVSSGLCLTRKREDLGIFNSKGQSDSGHRKRCRTTLT